MPKKGISRNFAFIEYASNQTLESGSCRDLHVGSPPAKRPPPPPDRDSLRLSILTISLRLLVLQANTATLHVERNVDVCAIVDIFICARPLFLFKFGRQGKVSQHTLCEIQVIGIDGFPLGTAVWIAQIPHICYVIVAQDRTDISYAAQQLANGSGVVACSDQQKARTLVGPDTGYAPHWTGRGVTIIR